MRLLLLLLLHIFALNIIIHTALHIEVQSKTKFLKSTFCLSHFNKIIRGIWITMHSFKPELKETATYRNNSTRLTEGGGDNKTQHSGGNGNGRREARWRSDYNEASSKEFFRIYDADSWYLRKVCFADERKK